MLKYVLKRLGMLALTMLLVSFLTFLAFELISGDPARNMLGTNATPAQVEALRHELGLDQPFFVRYLDWLTGFFSGNLGVSFSYRQPVWDLIRSKLGISLVLSFMSFLLISVISIPLGIFSYQWEGGPMDWL